MVAFLQANPPVDGDDLPRALAFEIAHKVGQRHCSHAAEPQPLGDMRHAARKKAATEHPGLCGVYHAHIIAAVKTSDVIEKWGEHNLVSAAVLLKKNKIKSSTKKQSSDIIVHEAKRTATSTRTHTRQNNPYRLGAAPAGVIG